MQKSLGWSRRRESVLERGVKVNIGMLLAWTRARRRIAASGIVHEFHNFWKRPHSSAIAGLARKKYFRLWAFELSDRSQLVSWEEGWLCGWWTRYWTHPVQVGNVVVEQPMTWCVEKERDCFGSDNPRTLPTVWFFTSLPESCEF